ncbi:hypothetical protein BJX96DRAFT_86798 [Aspergillus floccosus]
MQNKLHLTMHLIFFFCLLALAIKLPQVSIAGLDPHFGISATVFCLQYLQFLPICLLVIYLLILFMVLRLSWFDFVSSDEYLFALRSFLLLLPQSAWIPGASGVG